MLDMIFSLDDCTPIAQKQLLPKCFLLIYILQKQKYKYYCNTCGSFQGL